MVARGARHAHARSFWVPARRGCARDFGKARIAYDFCTREERDCHDTHPIGAGHTAHLALAGPAEAQSRANDREKPSACNRTDRCATRSRAMSRNVLQSIDDRLRRQRYNSLALNPISLALGGVARCCAHAFEWCKKHSLGLLPHRAEHRACEAPLPTRDSCSLWYCVGGSRRSFGARAGCVALFVLAGCATLPPYP